MARAASSFLDGEIATADGMKGQRLFRYMCVINQMGYHALR